jgi:DNA-directed RNA polymerase subunit M/transcription elongation factor TFIIS
MDYYSHLMKHITHLEIPDTTRAAWCRKVAARLNDYMNSDLAEFKCSEVLHYVTEDHVRQGFVNMHSDRTCVHLKTTVSEGAPFPKLSSPEHTFGETTSTKCLKCDSTKLLSMARQTRSSDEPTNYYFQCLQCQHRWKN